ncbi:hypothetical protein CYL31_15985 [Marinomonas sp. A3A]|uniref:flagellar hook-length control protein FliK n=1 Tax=Marinomonas sp. A3A TaxID=2065312 RepID=UPI001BB32872|nr:flagellar hook-length control protein FliK [Marinomonas sp. A3A]QUX92811.1 hypothetical protein CYL31_15985 [Marinomonas sp. A3A]
MRTDSNTVLSLPSGVPPKKSALTKAHSNNGAAFANDFNKAKETVSPKKTPTTDKVAASSSSAPSSSNSSSKTTQGIDKSSASYNKSNATVSDNEKGTTSLSGTSDVPAVESPVISKDGGKALQQDGEVSPADGSPVAVSAETSDFPVVVSPSDLKNTEITASLIPNSDAGQESQKEGVSQNLLADNVVADNMGAGDVVPITSTPIATEKASKDDIVKGLSSGGGVVGLDAIRRTAPSDVKNIDSTLSDTNISEGTIEPMIADDKGELSWVLSQMGTGVKAVPVTPTSDAVIDTTKAAASVAAGVIAAGAMNKENRTAPVPASLLNDGSAVASSDELNLDSTDSLLEGESILINEPIELRKKEQEAMLGRMSAQIDGNQGDDSSPGGLNSSLNNANRTSAAAATVNAAVANPNSQANLAMSLPPGHPGWANEMSQKVAWIARDGGHTAHIRLDPPELGSLTVKVSVDSDSNTQISFIAATPQARDLLEGQMGRLREMLAQQGMDLSRADVDVSQQDTSGAQDRANNRNGSSLQGSIAGSDDVDEELIPRNLSYVSASGVDYYA